MRMDIVPGTLITTITELSRQVGQKLGPTEWEVMAQDRVNAFADLTGDHNFIHVDPERARDTPFRGTIAHGFLTLSMLGSISQRLLRFADAGTSINYGLNKVRFPAPLKVGARFRMRVELAEVNELKGGAEAVYRLTYEVADEPKPCCVADLVFRYYS